MDLPSSKPVQGCWYFTSLLFPWKRHESSSPSSYRYIEQTGFFSLGEVTGLGEGKISFQNQGLRANNHKNLLTAETAALSQIWYVYGPIVLNGVCRM